MPTHKNKALKEKQEAEKFRRSEVSRLKSSLPDEPPQDKNVSFIFIIIFAVQILLLLQP